MIAEDLSGEDLSDVLELHSDASAWWVLPRDDYGAREVREIATALDLDDLALRDLLADDRRVKYEEVGQARLLITAVLSIDEAELRLVAHPVSLIATDRALICLAGPNDTLQPAHLLSAKAELLSKQGIEVALPILLTEVIASYERAVTWLEQRVDRLADIIFEGQPLEKDHQLDAFRLKRLLSDLRRVTEPMRMVLESLVDDQPQPRKAASGRGAARVDFLNRRWTAVAEHHRRVADMADAERETLASIFQTSLSLVDFRMNETVKKLSGWAAIIAVPTLITGFVGMNVGFPLYGTVAGFWAYLALLVATAIVLYLVFRRRGWL